MKIMPHDGLNPSFFSAGSNLCLLLVFVFVLALSGCSTNPARETEEHSPYNGLYSGGAEEKLTNEAAKTAETSEEAIALGDKAMRKGEYDQAVFQYIKAMELGGGDASTLNKIGDIQNKMGNYANASQAYQLSLELESDNQHALEGLGIAQLRNRNYVEAKANLLHALSLEPDLWSAHNALGTIADLQGDHTTAQNHYRQSLLMQPNSQEVINNYGYSLYLSGDWDAALVQFRKAININPEFKRAWYNTGLVYARQGKFDDALGAFDVVMNRPQAYNDIGYICMINGDYTLSETYFRKAIKLSSTFYKKAHDNLEIMMRLKTRNTGSVSDRNRVSGHDTDDAIVTGLSSNLTDNSGVNHSIITGLKAAKTGNIIAAPKVKARDGPGGTDARSGAADNPGAQAIVTATTDSKRSLAYPTEQSRVTSSPDNSRVSVSTESDGKHITTTGSITAESAAADAIEHDPADTVKLTAHSDQTNKSGLQRSSKIMEEQSMYREALLKLNKKQCAAAAREFRQFLTDYPDSQYADNATYWLGETYYVNNDYNEALEVFSNLAVDYPQSTMLAETRLKIGNIHYEKHDWSEARQELSRVVAEYPGTKASIMAEYQLKRMKREGH
jgi:tol-pal system protein YbgF